MSVEFTDRDFERLIHIRSARATFVEEIQRFGENFRRSQNLPDFDPLQVKRLAAKHESISLICEVFTSLAAPRSQRHDRIRFVLENHNGYIDDLLSGQGSDSSCSAPLPITRLRQAKFSEEQIKLTQRMASQESVELNERALGKLLAPVMSFEGCRKLAEFLSDEVGLLTRNRMGPVMVSSPGHLEAMYQRYLTNIFSVEEHLLEQRKCVAQSA